MVFASKEKLQRISIVDKKYVHKFGRDPETL